MGYRIVYGPMPKMPQERDYKPLRIQVLTAVFALLFVLTVRQAWPEGTALLREFLLPGEQNVTEAAFSEMIGDIREGESLGDALTAFCRQIVEHGTQEIY